MPRINAEQTAFTFVKGIITEASPLNFPPDASLDEENFDLKRDGTRSRRLGINYETGFKFSIDYDSAQVEDKLCSAFTWRSPGNDGTKAFKVIQAGEILYFYDETVDEDSLSTGEKSFTVDLNDFLQPYASQVGTAHLDAISGFGVLYVVSNQTEPFYITYDPATDTISTTQIVIEIRDFDGVEDGLEISEQPTTLSDAHKYNLRNQGWPEEFRVWNNASGGSSTIGDPIERTNIEVGLYPSNADIMYLFKDTDATDKSTIGSYNPFLLKQENILGNTAAPKGHYILNAFLDNKSEVSGINVPSLESPLKRRPNTVEFFAGRIFYAMGTTVYFSQILTSQEKSGRCYQAQDPTTEDLNELLDNDGGVIYIPDAGNIHALRVFRNFVLVYADNGVWSIGGGGDSTSFSATGLSVQNVSDIKVSSSRNVARVGETHAVIAEDGMYLAQQEEVSLSTNLKNITETTIQTLYNSISKVAKDNSFIVYDNTGRRVYWFYNSDPNFDATSFPSKVDSAIIFDIPLAAFYKYKIAELAVDSPIIIGGLIGASTVEGTRVTDVVDSAMNLVEDSTNDQVVANEVVSVPRAGSLKLISAVVSTPTTHKHTFAEFSDVTFVDWKAEDGTGITYSSYLETGYMTGGDAGRDKSTTYVLTSFSRTETGFVDNGSGGVAFDFPSGCLLQGRWDFTSSPAAGKWGTQQQAYKLPRNIILGNIGDPLDYSYEVITSKLKVRGHGKALHLRFDSEDGKDARIIGWQVLMTANARV